MTSDEILLALRLVAMGRPAHDEVKRLAEFLAVKPADVGPDAEPLAIWHTPETAPSMDLERVYTIGTDESRPVVTVDDVLKVTKPKRAKKAD